MACHGSGSQMSSKKTTAALILFLVVLGCHAFSAHCGRQLDGGGDGQTVRGMKIRPLEGKCKKMTCVGPLDCFCCLSTPQKPCLHTEAECVKVCRPQVLPPGYAPGPPPARPAV